MQGTQGTQDKGSTGYKGHRTGNTGNRTQNTDRKGTAGGTKPAQFYLEMLDGAGVSLRLLYLLACFAHRSLSWDLVNFFFSIIDSTAIQQRMSFVKTTNEPVPPSPHPFSPHSSGKKKKQKAAPRLWESSGGASEGLGLRDQGPRLRVAEAVTTKSHLIHHLLICICSS